ncbi:MAG: UbiA-like polyprenyltransferase [Nannocystaceae bacterium]|nr:putative 4-hydroxybenzoate polyprenyltransferase [bacterium]
MNARNGSLWSTLAAFGRMVRLSHTIFGLPFALASTALAHAWSLEHGGEGLTLMRLVWIVLAFTGARTAAMGFNRIVDRKWDAMNPRTADREIPAGVVGVGTAWGLTLGSAGLFVFSSAMLGRLPLLLSPLCLLVIGGYSLFKRFSWSSHLILGVALALAPAGAWVAVTGSLQGFITPGLLMLAVATWVAGFDVLYSLGDMDFDKKVGLHSIPARFGVLGALWISGGLHLVTVGMLVALHLCAGLGWPHAFGVALIGGLLAIEHWLVRPGDLSKLGKAFFDVNGYISLAYLACTLIDVWLG